MTVIDFIFAVAFFLVGYLAGRARSRDLLRRAHMEIQDWEKKYKEFRKELIELRQEYLEALDDNSDRPGE